MPRVGVSERRNSFRNGSIELILGGRRLLSFAPLDGSLKVGMYIEPIDRLVDVSAQPCTANGVLSDAGRRLRISDHIIGAELLLVLDKAASRYSTWTPRAGLGRLALLGGAAFGLLAAAYDDGSIPVREVPRWAVPIVRPRTLREGARSAFGTKATSPVVRALATAIRSPGNVQADFSNLALALVGADSLQPDQIARVLAAQRALHPIEDLPDPATLAAARKTVSNWDPRQLERVLIDAASRPDGLSTLFVTLGYAKQLGSQGRIRIASSLSELHDSYRNLVITAPARSAGSPGASAGESPRPLVEPQPEQFQHRIYVAPRAQPVASSAPLVVTRQAQSVDGLRVDNLTFVVPRTAGDLERWGRIMSNCLDTYGGAAAQGLATIIGIHAGDQLAYVIEVSPRGVVVQFTTFANREPSSKVRATVVSTLLRAGIINPSLEANRQWLLGVDF